MKLKQKEKKKRRIIENSLIIETVLPFLQPNEILCTTTFVSKAWKKASLLPQMWKTVSQERWSIWRCSEFGQKFQFCFLDGATADQISEVESYFGFKFRLDIKELIKECCIHFPCRFSKAFKYPTPFFYMEKVIYWENFEDVCHSTFGLLPSELFRNALDLQIFNPSQKHLMIGANKDVMILLNVKTWQVLAFDWGWVDFDKPLLRNEGTFDEWFKCGTSPLEVSENIRLTFEKLSDQELIPLKWHVVESVQEYFTNGIVRYERIEWRPLMLQFVQTVWKDKDLLCCFYEDVQDWYESLSQTEMNEFLHDPEMQDLHSYLQNFDIEDDSISN